MKPYQKTTPPVNESISVVRENSTTQILSKYNNYIVHDNDCAYNTHEVNPHFYCTKRCGLWLINLLSTARQEECNRIIELIKSKIGPEPAGIPDYMGWKMHKVIYDKILDSLTSKGGTT